MTTRRFQHNGRNTHSQALATTTLGQRADGCTQTNKVFPIILLLLTALMLPASSPTAHAQQTAPGSAKKVAKNETSSSKTYRDSKRANSIAILINDEPITGYEIDQRAALIALNDRSGAKGMRKKAEARWKSLMKNPRTEKRFREFMQRKNPQSREEAKKLQKQFMRNLQKNMIAGLRREARKSILTRARPKAREELIDEKLKLQAAKNMNLLAEKSEVDGILTGMAKRNKMDLKKFGTHMKSMGVDISTMRQRIKTQLSWRNVIRRQFGYQISITQRDVDRFVATASTTTQDEVELKVQRVVLTVPKKAEQAAVGQRIGEADRFAASFSGCDQTRSLAATFRGATFQDLGLRKPAGFPEPTRSLLLNAQEGQVLPPRITRDGVEVWVLCQRKILSSEVAKRDSAKQSLRQKELEVFARKHLKDLRQDASIEYR